MSLHKIGLEETVTHSHLVNSGIILYLSFIFDQFYHCPFIHNQHGPGLAIRVTLIK